MWARRADCISPISKKKPYGRFSPPTRIPVPQMAGDLGVSTKTAFTRVLANTLLLEKKIACIHQDDRETYSAPRTHFELRTLAIRCARKRVVHPIREAGMFSGAKAVE